jgi:hypothetical protein
MTLKDLRRITKNMRGKTQIYSQDDLSEHSVKACEVALVYQYYDYVDKKLKKTKGIMIR